MTRHPLCNGHSAAIGQREMSAMSSRSIVRQDHWTVGTQQDVTSLALLRGGKEFPASGLERSRKQTFSNSFAGGIHDADIG